MSLVVCSIRVFHGALDIAWASVIRTNLLLQDLDNCGSIMLTNKIINFVIQTFVFTYSITMVTGDGTQHFKCVKSCEEGYTLLTKGD